MSRRALKSYLLNLFLLFLSDFNLSGTGITGRVKHELRRGHTGCKRVSELANNSCDYWLKQYSPDQCGPDCIDSFENKIIKAVEVI